MVCETSVHKPVGSGVVRAVAEDLYNLVRAEPHWGRTRFWTVGLFVLVEEHLYRTVLNLLAFWVDAPAIFLGGEQVARWCQRCRESGFGGP